MAFRPVLLILASLVLALPAVAQDSAHILTIRQPEHGTLSISPAIPADGKLPAGTMVHVTARAETGYILDSLYHEVPGIFGTMYMESMDITADVRLDQDMTISALFLPSSEVDGFTVKQDIAYAKPGVKTLDYDVYTPDNADNLPMIVIIHGGGWRANTEDIMRGMAREIVKTGRYVVASIDYRWLGTADGDAEPNTMNDLINDVFGAIAHIQEHAREYGGDPGRIAVTGDSAGGHLSAVAATMPHMIGDGGFGIRDEVFEFLPSYLPTGKTVRQVRAEIMNAVQAAAPSYGVFSNTGYNGGPGIAFGDENAPVSWAEAIAPIHHIPAENERSVPHYLTRGTTDPLISDVMVTEYIKALSAQHQRVRYDQVPHASHAFFDWKPDARTRATFAQYGLPYIGEMVEFFDSVFYRGQ